MKVKKKGYWKCLLCGRDTFLNKTPHYCKGGYRKHKIIWERIKNDKEINEEICFTCDKYSDCKDCVEPNSIICKMYNKQIG